MLQSHVLSVQSDFAMGGNEISLDRESINNVLNNGNPSSSYLPLTDSQSRDLFNWKISTSNNPETKCYEQTYSKSIQFQTIGYFKGNVISFRFHGDHRPYIFFQHRNENYQASLSALLKYKNIIKKKAKNGYFIINDELKVSFFSLVLDDFYWVTTISLLHEHTHDDVISLTPLLSNTH